MTKVLLATLATILCTSAFAVGEIETKVVFPDQINVGEKFSITFELSGDVAEINDIQTLAIGFEPDTDLCTELSVYKSIEIKPEDIANNSITVNDLMIPNFSIDGAWELEYVVKKNGWQEIDPEEDMEEFMRHMLSYEEGVEFQVATDMEVDIEAPKVISYELEKEEDGVKVSLEIEDKNEVSEVSVAYMRYEENGNGSGGYYGLKFNVETNRWEAFISVKSPFGKVFNKINVGSYVSTSDSLRNCEAPEGNHIGEHTFDF